MLTAENPLFGNKKYSYHAVNNTVTENPDTVLKKLLQEKPHPAWITDEECRLVFANPAFDHLLLQDGKENVNLLYDLIPGGQGYRLFQKHLQLLASGNAQTLQQTITNKDGAEEVFLITLFLVSGGLSNPIICGEAINISKYTQKSTRLQKTNGNLLQLNHQSSSANWEWNMITNDIYRNSAMQQLTGFTDDESKNLSWWFSRIHPADCKQVRETIKNTLETLGHNWTCEYRFKNKAGNYMMVRDRGFVIYEDGQPVRMVGSFKDITETRQQELTEIKEKINEQQNMIESFLKIQEKEKDRISYELNENINQILAAAKMFIELITPADAECKKNKEIAVDYLSMGIKEIKKLYTEILTKQSLIGHSLADNIHMLANSLETGNATKVTCTLHDDIEQLSAGIKSTIFRIIQEQVKNISQYSNAKNATISVKLLKKTLEILIADDGIGFDAEEIKWGVGFSSSHQQVKLYNGSIQIKTASEKGCKMMITIPLHK